MPFLCVLSERRYIRQLQHTVRQLQHTVWRQHAITGPRSGHYREADQTHRVFSGHTIVPSLGLSSPGAGSNVRCAPCSPPQVRQP